MSIKQEMSVLIIDDSRLSRGAMRSRIRDRFPAWETDEAGDANQALAMAEAKNYDLFTVDINMPGMSGLELGPLLKEKNPAAYVIFLTANIQDATRKRIEAMGAGFVRKPIKPETVDRLLEVMETLA